MAANKNTRIPADALRNASGAYIIPLGNEDYILSEEELKKHAPLKPISWHFPSLKLLSFKNQTAEFSITRDGASYSLHIKIEKESLQVSCSCATQVKALCLHAYKALDKLLLYSTSTNYFSSFKPNGLVETAYAHRQHFI